ncbi:MAG: hypothetical protein HY700_15770 [Gemmatimonadetes bacterium]|nr:hypothetical protein [Gemmatimonadota bacterium]
MRVVARWSTLIMAVLLGALSPAPARAQAGSRTITGTAVDSASGKPLSGAMAYANRTIGGKPTGKDGRFALAAEPLEPFFVVRVPGYVPAKVPWSNADSTGSVGRVRLRRVKGDQDRFAVQAEDIRVYPQLARFYDRKANLRQGAFLTPDEVKLRGTSSLRDVIRQMPGLQRMCLVTREGELDCGKSLDRGPTTILNQPAQPDVCVAAIWYYGFTGPTHPSMEEVRMDEVIAIEGYERAGSTPAEFSGHNCGAMVLWMKPD